MEIKKIGIVRRVDELGRIVIPKEIRSIYDLNPGTSCEIYTTEEGIFLKNYNFINEPKYRILIKLAQETKGTVYVKKGENKYLKFDSNGMYEVKVLDKELIKTEYTVVKTIKDQIDSENTIVFHKKEYKDFDIQLLKYTIKILEDKSN